MLPFYISEKLADWCFGKTYPFFHCSLWKLKLLPLIRDSAAAYYSDSPPPIRRPQFRDAKCAAKTFMGWLERRPPAHEGYRVATHSIATTQVRRFCSHMVLYSERGMGQATFPVSNVTLGTGLLLNWIQSLYPPPPSEGSRR